MKKMKRASKPSAVARGCMAAAVAVLAMFLSGCTAMIKSSTVTVKVSSVPAGANVTNQGQFLGTTPCNIKLDNSGKQQHLICIRKDGYEDCTVGKASKFHATGLILDTLFFGLIGLGVDLVYNAPYSLPDSPIHVVLSPKSAAPPPSLPAPAPARPPPAPSPPPTPQPAPAAVAEGKNPLRVKRWKYDQAEQKAEFEFTVISDEADIFALRPWALQQIRQVCNDEYTQANPGQTQNMLGFSLVTELDMPVFMVRVAVHRIQPMSHTYDASTRTGTLKVDIGRRGDADYAGAYKWALDNIGVICSSKSVAMEAGQPLPEGAQYIIVSEKTNDDGTLEITFKTTL
ncbi:MAG: PEGA domain-containing protein [Kiritimatiellaeota bacterium]|nr:PEGA domain-containing protein [Kiritimatiellota bacterium]